MESAPDWLVVGKIVAAFGTKGELRVMSQTDFPQRFEPGAELWVEREDRSFTVEHCRWQKGQAVLKLGAVDDRDQAEELRGRYLRVPGSNLAELEEGEYYLFQLMGLTVLTEAGRELGRIKDVLQTGANDVYVVETPNGELLLPAIKDVIKDVNLADGTLVVHLLPGLMPGEAEAEQMIRLALLVSSPLLAALLGWQVLAQPFLNPNQLRLPPQEQVQTRLPKLGVHTRLTDEVEQRKIQRSVEMVREMGASWDAEYFPWNYIQRNGPNDWDWSHADLVVNHAHQQGLHLIVRFDGVPDWARPELTGHSLLIPQHYADFARFASAFAERYRDKVDAYVIWNEPNVDYEWGYRKPDPAGYGQLLSVVYPRLKQADPRAQVLAAALAPNGEHSDKALSDLDYLQQLYDSGGKPYFDGIAAHAYGWEHPPDEAPAPDRFDFRRVELERQIMVRNGDSAKQVFITESGWNDYTRWLRAVSPRQRIDYTLESVRLASQWDWLGAICLWELRLPSPAHNYSDAWTLVHFDFSPSPTYVALQRLASPAQPATWDPFAEQPSAPTLADRIGPVFDRLGHRADGKRYQLKCLFSDCRVPPDISLQQVQDAGVLKVVVDASFPPLETVQPGGQLAGIDVTIAQRLATELGVKVELTNMSSDGLKDAILAGKDDAIVSSFQVVPEWQKELAYSEPYYQDHIPVSFGLDAQGSPTTRVDTVDYVVAVRAGRNKLLNAINVALDAMMDSGELQRITEQAQWD